MAFTNNVMIVRHGLLAKLVKLWKENRLLEEIDRLPIELSPRKSKVIGRCCVHKERAVWKYKTLPLLGFDMQDEVDELTPLSEYAKQALLRSENKKENLMCVVDEACSSCVQVNYEITNLCRGCVARSCYMNCPKDAIRFKKNGQAEIDHDTCISCGKCHQNCPYHAIVYIPIPCEEVCPVKAISKDEYGVEHIDESKCIYCGKCVNACPFGAIFEISQVFDILQRLRNKEPMVAIVAPSILAQFAAPVEKVYGAIKSLGFLEVVEVAQGAMETTRHEAEELKEKLAEGQPFMTTSCCPSYIQLAEKHIPDLKKYISTTGSPMYYTARIVKEKYPDAKVVFVGPCVAKRKEVKMDPCVDFTLTFEEVGSVLAGMDIKIEEAQPFTVLRNSVREAHGFAQAGGVINAVKVYLKEDQDASLNRELSASDQYAFDQLYWNFFYHRHNEFWKAQAFNRLTPLVGSTNMLVCGEDLGMIPESVPDVMNKLQIFSLEIERMPKTPQREFSDLYNLPYHSVCTTSTHDMTPLRSWWKEDRAKIQRYYNNVLGYAGDAPEECTADLATQIVSNHLATASMLAIIPIQDWFAMDDSIKRKDYEAERINVPSDSNHYWRYRMHITLEKLIEADCLNNKITELIRNSGRK